MYGAAMTAVFITMLLGLVRAWKGPTVFDRILAVNMFGTQAVLVIAISGFMTGRPEWLDIAIVYGLVIFIGTIAVLQFAKFGSLADDSSRASR